MFILRADKNKLTLLEREPVTSGSVNVYEALFEFSEDWDGLTRTAVFKADKESRSVLLNSSNQCVIPWEVLSSHGRQLTAGVYGTKSGEIALPTVWANLGVILEGAVTGQASSVPTPELWEQMLDTKADGMSLDGAELTLTSGEKPISAVLLPLGGGGGETSDHRLLTGRDAEKQHPISAIDGLTGELERIPAPAEPITNLELEELLK